MGSREGVTGRRQRCRDDLAFISSPDSSSCWIWTISSCAAICVCTALTRFATSSSILGLHARDESRFAPREPDAVAFAHTTEEVSAILRTCSEHGVPVIPWGAGSSLEGHVLPVGQHHNSGVVKCRGQALGIGARSTRAVRHGRARRQQPRPAPELHRDPDGDA